MHGNSLEQVSGTRRLVERLPDDQITWGAFFNVWSRSVENEVSIPECRKRQHVHHSPNKGRRNYQ